jgi:SAM-dependent methyltransferase
VEAWIAREAPPELLARWQAAYVPAEFDAFYLYPTLGRVLAQYASLAPESVVVDLGCGPGHKTGAFRRLGLQAVGLDRRAEHLRAARALYPESAFIVADVERLPFADASVDALFSCSLLQYVARQEVLRECGRVLKPKGCAVFIENLGGSPFGRAYRALHARRSWSYVAHQTPRRHLRWKERAEFERVFSQVHACAFNLTTPLALLPSLLLHRWRGVSGTGQPSRGQRLLHSVDRALLHAFPFLAHYCWTALIRAVK